MLARTIADEVSMNVISRTNTMSTKGTMLISAMTPSSESVSTLLAMNASESSARSGGRARRIRRFEGGEQRGSEQTAVVGDRLHLALQDVERDDRRDRDQEPHRRRDERLGDTAHDRRARLGQISG